MTAHSFEGDRPFLVSGNGDLRLVEMKPDLSGPLPGGIDKIIIRDTDYVGLRHEGSHMYKINGKYYIFTIHWLRYGSKRRVEACFFSDKIDGPYVGNNVLDDDMGYHNAGVAQGGIVDTPDGNGTQCCSRIMEPWTNTCACSCYVGWRLACIWRQR